MALQWDKISSRACKESIALSKNEHPVLGTAHHAMASPMPYGLGVCAVVDDSKKVPLPLYYVSEKAASTRGKGVPPGWYVVATPGTTFELRLSAIQPKFPEINGKSLPPSHGTSATVFVDGLQVRTARANKSFNELIIPGFVESWLHFEGETVGEDHVRQFVFQKTPTVEEGVAKTEDAYGCILVQISSGPLQRVSLPSTVYEDVDLHNDLEKVGEKEAAKLGKSVKVSRNGRRTTTTYNMLNTTIRNPRVESTLAIFLREKFWLESRRIIDAHGKPWTPTSEPLLLSSSFRLAFSKRIKAPENENDPKRQKRDKQRPVVKDFIDLTSDD